MHRALHLTYKLYAQRTQNHGGAAISSNLMKTKLKQFSSRHSLCLLIAYCHLSLLVLTKLHSLTKLGTWDSPSTLTSQWNNT